MEEYHFGYRLLLVVLIILVNAFFAGAEVALVSVRQSRLKELAEEGQAGAQTALNLLANPERLLSVVQVGVTLASLGLGWAGEGTLFSLFAAILGPLSARIPENLLHGISFALAFLLMSYGHVVIGEVVPKNLAIEKADRLAVLVAPAVLVFYRVSGPFVYAIERSAAALSRIMGLHGEQRGGGHTPEELKFIIRSSMQLHPFEEDAIQRMLDLEDFAVREIMVPRNDIVSIDINASLDEVLELMNEHQFSRIPVYEKEPEHIVGIVHHKDLLGVWHERRVATEKRRPVRPFHLRHLARKPVVVPETKPLNQLIDDFRKKRVHMAMVVDEFGTIVGLVTMEDVLEQIFGEIEDEHDVLPPPPPLEAPILELDGSINIRDLETQYGIEVPVDAGFETLAGFLLFRLGYIPTAGESVEHTGYKFTVLELEGKRIARVRIEKIDLPAGPVS
jgi:putative hemolysin